MRYQDFKTKDLQGVLLYILFNRILCSKEISEMFIGISYNDRNIKKYLNRLAKEGLVKLVGIGLREKYSKSQFFTTDKNGLAQAIIYHMKKLKREEEAKAKKLGAQPHKIRIPSSKEDAIKLFLSCFRIDYRKEEKITYIMAIIHDEHGNEKGSRAIAKLKSKLPHVTNL
jgi:hypothetical protein